MLAETAATLEELKRQLRNQPNPEGAVTKDLYSHLNEVFNRIIKYHPYDAYEKFEEISQLVKQTTFRIEDPKFDFELNRNAQDDKKTMTQRQALEVIERAKNLLAGKTDVRKQDRELLTKTKSCSLPNLEQHAQMLEWAGVSFGDDYVYLL
jgi:hypothetical protein